MKLRVAGADLAAALARVKRAVATRPVIPATGMIGLSTEEGVLRVEACDGTQYITTHVPATVDLHGRVLVTPRIEKVVSNDEMKLELRGDWLVVRGVGELEAATLEYDLLAKPKLPRRPEGRLHISQQYVKLLGATTDPTNDVPRDSCVAVHETAEAIYLSTTSVGGAQLVVIEMPPNDETPEVYLSYPMLRDALAATDALHVEFCGNRVWAKSDDETTLASFPVTFGTPYHVEELLARFSTIGELQVDWATFYDVLDKASSFTLPNVCQYTVTLSVSELILYIESQGNDCGFYSAELPGSGPRLDVKLNAKLVLNAMKAFGEGKIEFLECDERIVFQIRRDNARFLLAGQEAIKKG